MRICTFHPRTEGSSAAGAAHWPPEPALLAGSRTGFGPAASPSGQFQSFLTAATLTDTASQITGNLPLFRQEPLEVWDLTV